MSSSSLHIPSEDTRYRHHIRPSACSTSHCNPFNQSSSRQMSQSIGYLEGFDVSVNVKRAFTFEELQSGAYLSSLDESDLQFYRMYGHPVLNPFFEDSEPGGWSLHGQTHMHPCSDSPSYSSTAVHCASHINPRAFQVSKSYTLVGSLGDLSASTSTQAPSGAAEVTRVPAAPRHSVENGLTHNSGFIQGPFGNLVYPSDFASSPVLHEPRQRYPHEGATTAGPLNHLGRAVGDRRDAQQMSSMRFELHPHSPIYGELTLQDLTTSITKIGNYPVARGGFGEIWKCTYQTNLGPIMVAVKSLLIYACDEVGEAMEKKITRMRRELKTCARLKHPNILDVYGHTSGFGPVMAIVSPWAENGNLTSYLGHEGKNLSVVRRFQILVEITAGLQYLHTNNVIHGDLTGSNVLVHGDGTTCLADFGLSLMYSEVTSISQASWTSTFHGNFRWLAPELLGHPENELPVRPSKQSDIYSFGGIMLQVLTSKVPYHYLGEAAVILSIGTKVKPMRSRYPAFPDKYWEFIEACWSSEPPDRPSAEKVVEVIMDEYDSLPGAGSSNLRDRVIPVNFLDQKRDGVISRNVRQQQLGVVRGPGEVSPIS